MQVISFIGRARSGKDTSADYIMKKLQSEGYKVKKDALAAPLKIQVAQNLDVSLDTLDECKNLGIRIKGADVRKLLQSTADEIRFVDDKYFVRVILDKIVSAELSGIDVFIITDMRLKIEQKGLRGISEFVRIVRDEAVIDESGHNTATEVKELSSTYTIVNDGTIDELYTKLDTLINCIMTH